MHFWGFKVPVCPIAPSGFMTDIEICSDSKQQEGGGMFICFSFKNNSHVNFNFVKLNTKRKPQNMYFQFHSLP